jgi:hypothetical protein
MQAHLSAFPLRFLVLDELPEKKCNLQNQQIGDLIIIIQISRKFLKRTKEKLSILETVAYR